MTQKALTKADLHQFCGTEIWYRHSLVKNFHYTEGVHYVARKGGAYWLIDEIAFAQAEPKVKAEHFQFWKLVVNPDTTAQLSCEDGNGGSVYSKQIEYTDFPLEDITFYFTDSVLLLPAEY